MSAEAGVSQTDKPVRPDIRPKFISHGTLASRDLERTRRFYEDFLHLEVVRTSPISMMVRLGSDHVYAVVQSKEEFLMPRLNHNGLDVDTDEDVDEAWRTVQASAETWGLTRITRPVAQHGTYSFMFWDFDGNCWEILNNPRGGYRWIFEKGDQEGRGHLDRNFRRERPED
jgi:catechol 2,3-dioxygenase-like lactoylglutathione lyase family enzyme